MATQPIQGEVFRLDRLFRSDILPSLRRFFDASPEMSHLVERRILQIRAIVDANVVQRELRWRLGFREKPDARSGLEEAIDAGVLVLIAPDFLKLEIEKYLLAIANQSGVTLADAQREWELFQAKLCFYRPLSHVTEGVVVDPKDLPYKYASDDLALPVYTRDRDLVKMGAPVVWVCIDTACRDHARATSVKLGFTVGSTYTVTIGVGALGEAARAIKSLFQGFRRLSPWLQFAIAGGIAAVLIHPKSRAKLLQAWNSLTGVARQAKGPVFQGLLLLMQQLAEAESDATRTLKEAQAALPPAMKGTAIVYVRRVCVLSNEPLAIEEIVRRMRNEGYVARGQRPEAYVGQLMRKSDQFVEVSAGLWKLRSQAVCENLD